MDAQHGPRDPDGLARTIAERRRQLGLTHAELAERAGIDAGYLEYLERSAGAVVSGAAMLRLAAALGTTLPALAGGDEVPPGHASAPVGAAELVPLGDEACRRRLEAGGVGRVVYVSPGGPVAYPVNYAVEHGCVLFATSPALAAEIEAAGQVGFEVDRIDEVLAEGWSVLVDGRARPAGSPGAAPGPSPEPGALGPGGQRPSSWLGPGREALVAIEIDRLTGRELVHPPRRTR